MTEEWDEMRITACKAEEDYKLWLRFEDGLEGSVFLGNLLEIGAFQLWRDAREFQKVSVDPETAKDRVVFEKLTPLHPTEQLRLETEKWKASIAETGDLEGVALNGVIGSVAHLAYHLGAIRQISRDARGPVGSRPGHLPGLGGAACLRRGRLRNDPHPRHESGIRRAGRYFSDRRRAGRAAGR